MPEFLLLLVIGTGLLAVFIALRRLRHYAAATRARLMSTVDALPALVSYADAQRRFQFVNRAYEEWFGRPRAEVVGRPIAEIVGPEAYAVLEPYLVRAFGGEALRFRSEIPTPQGSRRVVDVCYVPARGQDNKVSGLWSLVLDVTEDARAAQAMRDAEVSATTRFQMMADHAPVLIWMSGPDKSVTWVNRPWLAFTGRTLAEELGGGWADGLHPDDRDRCLDVYSSSFDARQPFTMEYRLRRRDGEYRWVLDTGIPLYDRSGPSPASTPGDEREAFLGYIGSCIDITVRRRVEQERQKLLVDAETANRIKDEFLATLSHELRTPLNTVLGWTHLLREGTRSETEITNALDVIERNVRVQSKLVEDVLDVSRIVSGKLRLELQNVDIANVVQAAVNVLQPTADARGVVLSVNVRQGHGFVAGDPARLHQAIWNIVSNGVKFTRRGGSVDVLCARREGHIDVIVSDTGIGIEPEFLPHVFERFRQAEGGYAREYGGLGLGLAIVRHLVELHGGSVDVQSPGKDKGTTVTLTFPLLALHPSEAIAAPAEAAPPVIAGVRVLAVDDDPDALGLLKRILEDAGAIVTGAESAADALAAMDGARFDVLLSDLAMPVEDGCDLMRSIRALPPERGGEIPSAALTAYARSEDRTRVLMAGFNLHIAKPIDPGELLAVVQTLAARRPPSDL